VSALLALRGLTLRFGGLSVIEDLHLDIESGSRTALIGPNGAGKTTIFNLVSGVYAPTSGDILMESVPIQGISVDRRVYLGLGRTFQNIRLMKHLTVLENVLLGQHSHVGLAARYFMPLKSRWNKALIDEALSALDLTGIYKYAEQLADGLPYGVQKRVEIARALLTRPKLLMLDEPAAGLNSVERIELLYMLQTAIPQSITILVVEHDIGFVRSLCGHVTALSFGRKIAEGRAEAVCGHPAVIEAYLGKHDGAPSTSQERHSRHFDLQRDGHAA
jgi:branched-chain amino acid transport system ATP-binding protein